MIRPRVVLIAIPVLAALTTALTAPALACGALVATNGAVRLSQTTTLVSWSGGVERYLTSFAFKGRVEKVGWIIPLPAAPVSITEGGAWTLQRLELEFHPARLGVFTATPSAAARKAVVIERVQVGALGIRVIRGSGDQILSWCHANGFDIQGVVGRHLLRYAAGSPYFMVARYDLAAVRHHHLTSGDGTPVLMTFRTAHLWVPLEVLADDGQLVRADLFLLTDSPLVVSTSLGMQHLGLGEALPGTVGLRLSGAEPMNPGLHQALASDRHMGWVPTHGWVSYLTLRAAGTAVTYDLALNSAEQVRLVPFGTPPQAAATTSRVLPDAGPGAGAEMVTAGLVLTLAAVAWLIRRRPRTS